MKKQKINKKGLIDAIATITGTTIGAGIFGLPYVFAKSGFVVGLINMFVIFLAILIVNLYTARITFIRKKPLELTGYAKILLGDKGKHLMALFMFLSIIGALLAYIIGTGSAIESIFHLDAFTASIISFALLSFIVYFGLEGVKKSETILTTLMIFIVVLLIALSFSKFNIRNVPFTFNFSLPNLFFPYGVILFSFLCIAAIPEARQELKGNETKLKKAIVIGTAIPLIIYILFAFAIVGISGNSTTEIATTGLYNLGYFVMLIANLFVILAMSTSFITLALALKWVLQYDYGINKTLAWFISCFTPFILFLIGFRDFIKVLSFTGAIAGGLQLILILFMANKTKKLKTTINIPFNFLLIFILFVLFVLGIIYQFIF